MAEKKLTIGMLISGIMDQFSVSICYGASQTAREQAVNLVVIPGKYLNRDLSATPEIMYEYQFNTLFQYVKKEAFDGIIVAADCIGCLTTEDNVRRLMAQYAGIPCILLASQISGYDNITYDNKTGVKEAIRYLIREAGCKKFGMIGGPGGNHDGKERKEALLETLEEAGIPFDESCFVEGNLSRKSHKAARKLLDAHGDLDAIFCVNDDTAIALYEVMEERGLEPGRDIKVLGYDNTVGASKMNPPLSSVWADPVALGARACQMLLDQLHGKTIESLQLQTKFVKRKSFGDTEGLPGESQADFLSRGYIEECFQDIFYRYQNSGNESRMAEIKENFFDLFYSFRDLQENVEEGSVVCKRKMDEFLADYPLDLWDTDNMMAALERIQSRLMQEQRDIHGKHELLKLFDLLHQKIIYAMDRYLEMLRGKEESYDYSLKIFVKDLMQFDKGNDLSYSNLLINLGFLQIKNASVYIFEKPVTHLDKEVFTPPAYVYLKAVLQNGKVQNVPSIEQKIKTSDIFYREAAKDADVPSVLFPLFFNELIYGVMLFDLEEPVFNNGEFLVNQMSAAAKMIDLLKSNEAIQQQLEESMAALRENNIELDNLSRYDALTGIYNRRGFMDSAEKMYEDAKAQKQNLLVLYADMNNLKIINDRYGHEEGDFSIKLIADVLKSLISWQGIVGRIGGDEYAGILKYEGSAEAQKLVELISRTFEQFNAGSDKDYNVTVSVGTGVLYGNGKMTLKEALSQADESLYKVKKLRKKTVAKTDARKNA